MTRVGLGSDFLSTKLLAHVAIPRFCVLVHLLCKRENIFFERKWLKSIEMVL